ncbi:MAG: hypothetical protein CYPHOPRED_005742 [Cyphobasidiales sp. Tagirdzhanova-0007]|nr:MAG: hypothetical protein CYPHOPRED_005742 [Cyphobasidiales sp. Tagirdzhanova-0007]
MSLFSTQKRPAIRYGNKGRLADNAQSKAVSYQHVEAAGRQTQSSNVRKPKTEEISEATLDEDEGLPELLCSVNTSVPTSRLSARERESRLTSKQVRYATSQESSLSTSKGKGKQKSRPQDDEPAAEISVSTSWTGSTPPPKSSSRDVVQVLVYKRPSATSLRPVMSRPKRRRIEQSDSESSPGQSSQAESSPSNGTFGNYQSSPFKSTVYDCDSPSSLYHHQSGSSLQSRAELSFPSLSIESPSRSPSALENAFQDVLESSPDPPSKKALSEGRCLHRQLAARTEVEEVRKSGFEPDCE